jgi:hypothetical protein
MENAISTIKDKTTNAVSYIGDLFKSSGSSTSDSVSSTFYNGTNTFKGTSLGESFFKNMSSIFITVLILIGGIMYINFAKEHDNTHSITPATIQKSVTLEPATTMSGGLVGASEKMRHIPNKDAWTAPIKSIQAELTEGFGTEFADRELEKIHTNCNDSFCIMYNKSPQDLENACNTISNKKLCDAKCCCGWAKFTGHDAETDQTRINNNVIETKQMDGKCVSGNSKKPLLTRDDKNEERDMEYYYYMGKCVGGRACNST